MTIRSAICSGPKHVFKSPSVLFMTIKNSAMASEAKQAVTLIGGFFTDVQQLAF